MSFKALAGQEELRRSLTKMLIQDRLSHAILLAGPSGSGKKSWGRALAQAVLCINRRGSEACLECLSCRQFSSGNHPEYFFIEPESRKIKIEQVRSLRMSFHLLGDRKVCLINRAETMTPEASSSLLKVLEDPPEGLYFILLAEQPQLLFDTILSRCQRYTLQPLQQEEIQGLLVKTKGLSVDKAILLSRISGGTPGRAIEFAEDENFDQRFEEAELLASSLASGGYSSYHLISKAASLAERDDLLLFLDLLCFFFRDSLVGRLCRRERLLLNCALPAPGKGSHHLAGMEEIIRLIDSTVYELTATNVNRRLLLEKMLIMMQRRLTQCPG